MSNQAWSDADPEATFATVGRYVIVFQWIEGRLDQILLLGWGAENWAASQAKLLKMKNSEKIDAVKNLVLNSSVFARARTRSQWCAGFELLIGRLHEERDRRNSLVHSQYLFEIADAGLAPLRSHRKKVDGKATFHQEYLTKAAKEKLLRELVQLAMDVNHTHVQLIHDYEAPAISASPIDVLR